MKVQVLQVRKTTKGRTVVHIQCGDLFGDCVATSDVTEPGEYELRTTLRVVDGRLIPLIRVEK